MRNQTPLEELSSKISLVAEQFTRVNNENIELKKELEELKVQLAQKDKELVKLREDSELLDMEIEEINDKISRLLS